MKNGTPELSANDFDRVEEAKRFIRTIEIDADRFPTLVENSETCADIAANEISLRAESEIAALLYNFVHYEFITLDSVRSTFGNSVAYLVEGIVKIVRLNKRGLTTQTDSFIQLVLTLSPDPRSVLILLAEQLRQLRSFKSVDEHYREEILKEVHHLYAPIAHRLGLYAIKTELEELWMKNAHYPIFREIADQLAAKKGERELFISGFIAPLKTKMAEQEIACEIKGRPKSIYSIWNKMKVQHVSVEGVYDKFAIRIIIDTDDRAKEKELCWKAYSIVTEEYIPFPKRLRDWISHPKSSGYESLHTTVQTEKGEWVEVQIRSRRMDEIAEKGHAAHWKYKEKSTGTKSDWLAEMRSALENRNESGRANELKSVLYGNDIFIFTPENEIKQLRAGSTILDFAFAVHSDVGLTCNGGTVNGKHVTIRQVLKNGDIVSVTTNKRQMPNEEWLEFVHSAKAKNRIKRALKDRGHKFFDVGKELVKRKLEQLDISFDAINLDKLVAYFGVANSADLYEGIGEQTLDILQIKTALETKKPEQVEPELEIVTPKTKSIQSQEDALVIDESISGIQYSLAKCCNPVRGDQVFGFISVNKGVRVHRMTCPNAADLFMNHAHRIVSAQWTRGKKEDRFKTKLRVTGRDEPNILSSVVNCVRAVGGVHFHGINVIPDQHHFSAELTIQVESNVIRDEVIQRIREIRGIESAYQL